MAAASSGGDGKLWRQRRALREGGHQVLKAGAERRSIEGSGGKNGGLEAAARSGRRKRKAVVEMLKLGR